MGLRGEWISSPEHTIFQLIQVIRDESATNLSWVRFLSWVLRGKLICDNSLLAPINQGHLRGYSVHFPGDKGSNECHQDYCGKFMTCWRLHLGKMDVLFGYFPSTPTCMKLSNQCEMISVSIVTCWISQKQITPCPIAKQVHSIMLTVELKVVRIK